MTWTLLLHTLYFGRLFLLSDEGKEDILVSSTMGRVEDPTAAVFTEIGLLLLTTLVTEYSLDNNEF